MAISRGLSGQNLEELLSELQTTGESADTEPILEARLLPSAGEVLSGDLAMGGDWVPIELDA